jgi:hypothetical protein
MLKNFNKNCMPKQPKYFNITSTSCHSVFMRESNRNLDIPPPGIPGEFACLVFEEGGNLTFFSSGRWGICLRVGKLNFSFKHVC